MPVEPRPLQQTTDGKRAVYEGNANEATFAEPVLDPKGYKWVAPIVSVGATFVSGMLAMPHFVQSSLQKIVGAKLEAGDTAVRNAAEEMADKFPVHKEALSHLRTAAATAKTAAEKAIHEFKVTPGHAALNATERAAAYENLMVPLRKAESQLKTTETNLAIEQLNLGYKDLPSGDRNRTLLYASVIAVGVGVIAGGISKLFTTRKRPPEENHVETVEQERKAAEDRRNAAGRGSV